MGSHRGECQQDDRQLVPRGLPDIEAMEEEEVTVTEVMVALPRVMVQAPLEVQTGMAPGLAHIRAGVAGRKEVARIDVVQGVTGTRHPLRMTTNLSTSRRNSKKASWARKRKAGLEVLQLFWSRQGHGRWKARA